MFVSARQYSALLRVYSEMFAPVPDWVLDAVAKNGKLWHLGDALNNATNDKEPIKDWTPFVGKRDGF